MALPVTSETVEIKDVWAHNLDEEMDLIKELIESYPYVAIDTEFPGTVFPRPVPISYSDAYANLRENVNATKLIQVGLALADSAGNLPVVDRGGRRKYCVWQFNFRDFSPLNDLYVPSSVELLRNHGISFSKLRLLGADSENFIVSLMTSGVVLNQEVSCITFQGDRDVGYLLKLLLGKDLPATEAEFTAAAGVFFPNMYDLKRVMQARGVWGGLRRLADAMEVERIGASHQGGSDSLVTLRSFFRVVEVWFGGDVNGLERFKGVYLS